MKSFTRILLLCLSAILIITSCKKDDAEPKKYTLTVAANPTIGGTVTGGGAYKSGEDVALTATANAEYTFVNWKNGDVVVSTDANFTYTTTAEDVTLTATFALKTYTLTLNIPTPNGSGTVSGGGVYLPGTSVNLIATPGSGWAFENWTKGANVLSTNATYSYTTTAEDVTIAANFIPTFTLTISVDPVGAGTVTGAGNYPTGTSVNITATPNAGYAFVKWTEGSMDISTNANYTYTTGGANATLKANFVRVYALTVNTNLANSGVVTGGGNYQTGTSVDLTATPSIGYTFVNWTKGGAEVSTNTTYNYTTTASDETITANFTEKTYLITLGAQSHLTIGAFYSIAQNTIYNQTDASNNQSAIDLICFYEHDVVNNRINDITLSSPGANITGIFGGGATDPSQWATKRLTLFTPPTSTITTTQFDALHQNDPAIQTYFNSSMTSSNKKAKLLAVDNIYAFKTADNVYGLFKVTNVINSADGLVEVVLKFRK